MSSPYIGEIRMFGGSFAPAGWAMCDGQLMPISENDALFVLIGTTYGGDGQETFGLPNLQSRVPIHVGNGLQLGESGGTESETLTVNQIPIHNHPPLCRNDNGGSTTPTGSLSASFPDATFYAPPPVVGDPPLPLMGANSLSPSGGSQPHENMMPYAVVTFIISLFGIFPTQT